jgi:MSHA pilin protein MshD
MLAKRRTWPNDRRPQRGVGLVELLIFIMIVGVALTGALLSTNLITGKSADTLVQKEAQTAAESLLEEIESRTYSGGPCTGTLAANAPRSGVANVCDYAGYTTTAGILDLYTNTAVLGLTAYNVSPAVEVTPINSGELGTIPAASAVRITVHVTTPSNTVASATGYRTAY